VGGVDGHAPRVEARAPSARWLRALRRYFAVIVPANLVWEFAHLPLYTIWETGTLFELAFAALHCTGGDILIALSTLVLALFLVGDDRWPASGFARVAALTIVFGLAYTLFSEWLNIEVRGAWAYRDLMPVVPILDAGLSPLLQWMAIPLAAFWWAHGATVPQQPGREEMA
jgi:hypothetical protein